MYYTCLQDSCKFIIIFYLLLCQDLKRDEEEKEEILEELKSKNIVLKYLLKKEM